MFIYSIIYYYYILLCLFILFSIVKRDQVYAKRNDIIMMVIMMIAHSLKHCGYLKKNQRLKTRNTEIFYVLLIVSFKMTNILFTFKHLVVTNFNKL